MADKSIIIIGAGIAGLSAGCYGQMNGYRTQIFELHDKPGGLCTSWKRKGYTFDGCIHWLIGSGPGASFHHIWEELGAVQGRRMVNHEEYLRVEGTGGKTFIVHTDIDRLEQHMKELAPADVRAIEEFCNAVRLFTRFEPPMDKPRELFGILDSLKMGLKMLPFMQALRKWSRTSTQDFAARFSDPFLRQAFSLVFDLPDFPMVAVPMTLAYMHSRDAGYPIGGSLAFSRDYMQKLWCDLCSVRAQLKYAVEAAAKINKLLEVVPKLGIFVLYITPLRALNRDIHRRIIEIGNLIGINMVREQGF